MVRNQHLLILYMVSYFMRFFTLAAFFIFTAFCVIVAVSNRTIVTFSLNPLPFSLDLPLYYLLFAGIFIGLGAGALVVLGKAITQAQHKRKQAKKIRNLENRLKELESPPTAGIDNKDPSE